MPMGNSVMFYLRCRSDRGGVWYVSWYIDGKQTSWRASGCTDKGAAEAWARANTPTAESEEARASVRAEGKRVKAPEVVSKQVRFSTYAKGWFTENHEWLRRQEMRGNELSQSYLYKLRRDLANHIIPRWGDCKLRDIGTPDLEDWLYGLRETKSSDTVNHILSCMRIMMAYATRKGIIPSNPVLDCERMVGGARTRQILTIPEARAIFDERNLETFWDGNVAMFAFNLCGASLGMRMGEIQGLQVKHVRVDDSIPHVQVRQSWHYKYGIGKPKTKGSNRDIPMPSLTLKYLRLVIENKGQDDMVFPGESGNPIDHKVVGTAFRHALSTAGIDDFHGKSGSRWITFHSHRHFFVSSMRGKMPEHQLMALSGHSTTMMVAHYTHTGLSDMAGIAAIQDGILNGGTL